MPNCNSLCGGTIPASAFGTNCGINFKKGGITYLVFKTCDVDVPISPTIDGQNINASAWQPLIDACKIRISNEINASLTSAEGEKTKMSACRPAVALSSTLTLAFEDYTSSVSGSDIDFWNYIVQNQSKLEVGWITCDQDFFGFWPFSIYVGTEIPNDNQKPRFRKGTIEIIESDIIKPISIIGFQSLLLNNASRDCATGGYANDYNDYIDQYDFDQN